MERPPARCRHCWQRVRRKARSDTTSPPPPGGTLRYASAYNFRTFDPAFADSEVSVDQAIYEGLITYAPGSFDTANQLAEEFEALPDGLTYSFKLKEGIPFHDGFGEVTAEDVKFTYERTAGMTKPVVNSYFVADWAPHLDRVDVSGKYEEPSCSIDRSLRS